MLVKAERATLSRRIARPHPESVMLPLGRYLGAADDGGHEVERGGVAERLDKVGFAVWGLAHGPIDPVLAAGKEWTRAELVSYAGLAGIPDPDERVARLAARGLLVDVSVGSEASDFASSHRVVPLAVGLGNHPEEPDRFTIGLFDRPLVQVDELRYEVWCWSSAYDTLWQVCEARAAMGGEQDPAEVLAHFLTGVHQMASANALYLDVIA
jgi:hypothetical protein